MNGGSIADAGENWRLARRRRPDRALHLLGDGSETFVHKLLYAAALVGFGRVEIALRVDGDTVHGIELPGVVAAFAEVGELGHRLAIVDVQLLVAAVGQIQI